MMSIRAYKWAKEQELPGVPKAVLIYLGDRFNDVYGYAWPSMARIARDTGWHQRTVAKAIRYLKETGLVETRRQYYLRDHSLGPNRYYLPDIGPVPPEGAKFPIKGDFDNQGEWDSDLDDDYWD
uniref:helix-turn-helix domain-containing protein n=1 Tax=Aquiluna sp. TaxID=2053504 RepID=UPI0040476ADB